MFKLLLFCALLSVSFASHLGPARWYINYVYNGLGCQGDPILVSVIRQSCTPSTTLTCLPDVAPNEGTSFTQVCVSTLRDYVKTIPKNYAAEVFYDRKEGNNCTNPNAAIGMFIYGMNTCIPTPYGAVGTTWRLYDVCNATVMNSQRNCTNTQCNSCSGSFARQNEAACYPLDAAVSTSSLGSYTCNSLPQAVLDVVAPAEALKPTAISIAFILAFILGNWM